MKLVEKQQDYAKYVTETHKPLVSLKKKAELEKIKD